MGERRKLIFFDVRIESEKDYSELLKKGHLRTERGESGLGGDTPPIHRVGTHPEEGLLVQDVRSDYAIFPNSIYTWSTYNTAKLLIILY